MNTNATECTQNGHMPGMWMRVDFNRQERRCTVCGFIVVTANIPNEDKPTL